MPGESHTGYRGVLFCTLWAETTSPVLGFPTSTRCEQRDWDQWEVSLFSPQDGCVPYHASCSLHVCRLSAVFFPVGNISFSPTTISRQLFGVENTPQHFSLGVPTKRTEDEPGELDDGGLLLVPVPASCNNDETLHPFRMLKSGQKHPCPQILFLLTMFCSQMVFPVMAVSLEYDLSNVLLVYRGKENMQYTFSLVQENSIISAAKRTLQDL